MSLIGGFGAQIYAIKNLIERPLFYKFVTSPPVVDKCAILRTKKRHVQVPRLLVPKYSKVSICCSFLQRDICVLTLPNIFSEVTHITQCKNINIASDITANKKIINNYCKFGWAYESESFLV